MKHISHPEFKIEAADLAFDFQPELTPKLDERKGKLDQNWINEVVLWKVDRYASVDAATLKLLKKIDPEATAIDETLTRDILQQLLSLNGFQIPMASTVLRFVNPHIYQIIDQRVFRVLYGESGGNGTEIVQVYKDSKGAKSKPKIEAAIVQYLQYLKDLRKACKKLKKVPFELADRILYMADRRLNEEPLKGYGSTKK